MEKITVLLAVYNPNMEWLAAQLDSIERQDYPEVEVLVLDDGSGHVEEQAVRNLLQRCLKDVPYHYRKNTKNQGSNKTFEQLTLEADGSLLAYCDQDDIWEDRKLSLCYQQMKKTQAGLVCSGVSFIDADGRELSQKTEIETFAGWAERGKSFPLWQRLVFRNFAPGCSMLVEAGLAKAALPFANAMYHDHYLALWAALYGSIAVCREKLVRRRLHGQNQTAFFSGIRTKEDYITGRIQKTYEILDELQDRLAADQACLYYLARAKEWSMARQSYAAGDRRKGLIKMLKNIRFNPRTTLFEILCLPVPSVIWSTGLAALHSHRG